MYLDIVCVTGQGEGVTLFAGEGQEKRKNHGFPWNKELVLFKFIQSCKGSLDILEGFLGPD